MRSAAPVAAAVLLAALGVGYGLKAGWGRAGRVALLGLTAAMLLFHLHAGWALAFQTGDVPKDMLIYVQTSPGLRQEVDDAWRARLCSGNVTESTVA